MRARAGGGIYQIHCKYITRAFPARASARLTGGGKARYNARVNRWECRGFRVNKSFPKSLVEVAANEVRDLIMKGELRLGQRVTEQELAARFGMSKTPMREALQLLQREGLVTVLPRQGTFVFNFTEELMAGLRGVRSLLETYALREAVKKNRGRLLHALGENIAKAKRLYEASGTVPPYFMLDSEFHASFFQFADNPFLDTAYSAIQPKLVVLWRLKVSGSYGLKHIAASIAGHEEIAGLILDGDIDAACAALDEHNNRAINSAADDA